LISKNPWKLISFLLLACFLIGSGYFYYYPVVPSPEKISDVEVVAIEQTYPHIIPPRSTLYDVLRELNVTPVAIQEIVDAAKPVMNLGRLRAGTQFRLMHLTDPSSELTGIEFKLSPIEKIEVKKENNAWKATRITETVESKVQTYSGIVKSTLWESAEDAHMDPNLISQLAEIFSWQIDFAREVRVKDRWRLSVEQKLVNGKAIGWGSIIAAQYENAGQMHNAVLFKVTPEQSSYFGSDGSSLKRMFLKSPIRFGRISSRFSRRRFHPILLINRPHLGVDYAAPVGTPIRTVGAGTVTVAGWSGGGGNMIRIRHNSTYQTAYLHLSRIQMGIHPGVHVDQGQVIGFVGMTGLSTGPHLHFEFAQNGKVLDPLSQKFPSAEPVPPEKMSEFQVKATSLLGGLPAWASVSR
jgi:murein DD-endopeptidase MepM/ murein hydrolase activator NlpD